MELDGIQTQMWKDERVVLFQSVILQHIRLVTCATNICARIDFLLNCCNLGAFDELVNYTYTASMGYLGKARRIQI